MSSQVQCPEVLPGADEAEVRLRTVSEYFIWGRNIIGTEFGKQYSCFCNKKEALDIMLVLIIYRLYTASYILAAL